MSDIVTRLRESMAGFDTCAAGAVMAREAADEIERLRHQVRQDTPDPIIEATTVLAGFRDTMSPEDFLRVQRFIGRWTMLREERSLHVACTKQEPTP